MASSILKAAAHLAKSTAKATKAGAKKGAKATAEAGKKGAKKAGKKAKSAAKRKLNKVKKNVVKSLGLGGIGGLIGSVMDARSAAQETNAANAAAAAAASEGQEVPQPTSSTIAFEGLAEAIAAAMPNLEGLDDGSNRSDANLASIIVREGIMLPVSIDGEEDPEIKAHLNAGQFISTRILQIGQLFSMFDMLKQQVGLLQVDLGQTNDNLALIAEKLGVAIDQNARTNRETEREQDEEQIENKEKATMLGNLVEDAKTSAKAGAAVVGGIVATAVGGALMMTAGFLLEDAAEEGFGDDEEKEGDGVQETAEEASEEQPIEETQGALDGFVNWLEQAEDKQNTEEKSIAQSAVGASFDNVGTALSVVGTAAAVTGATVGGVAVAPLAAAATAGYIAGTVIYEQTGLKEGIDDMITRHLEGESLDVSAGSTPTAMKEKYGNKEGAELLGDLLGEGMFDLAEDPEDITAFFRDNVEDMEAFNKLNAEYVEEFDRPITSALGDVLGTKGVESIFDIILANAMKKIEQQKKDGTSSPKEINGFKVDSVTRTAPMRGAEIPDPNQAPQQSRVDRRAAVMSNDGVAVDEQGNSLYDEETKQAMRDFASGGNENLITNEEKPSGDGVTKSRGPTATEKITIFTKDGTEKMNEAELIQAYEDGRVARGEFNDKLREFKFIKQAGGETEIVTETPVPEEEEGLFDRIIDMIQSGIASSMSSIAHSMGDVETPGSEVFSFGAEPSMPNIEQDTTEKGNKIIPVIAPIPQSSASAREPAGNTAKQQIGSAAPSVRTDDSFLSSFSRIFT